MFALFPGAWVCRHQTTVYRLRVLLVNVAISFLIPNAPARASPTHSRLLAAVSLLVFTSIVFRSEVAFLLAPVVFHAILSSVAPFRVIKTGIISAAVSIGEEDAVRVRCIWTD